MKQFVLVVVIIGILGIGGFFVYQQNHVSTDFKEKAELAIDALDTATTKVCDDDLSYIPASVQAKLAVEEACAESHAATTAALRIGLSWRVINLDADHRNCMLEKSTQKTEREIRAMGGKTTLTPLSDHKQENRDEITKLRKELQELQ
ncbi:MAG: hypothetical protein ABSD98_17140 [Candidatus Korobacteraceae bacterium]|jgi:hypothetical protein